MSQSRVAAAGAKSTVKHAMTPFQTCRDFGILTVLFEAEPGMRLQPWKREKLGVCPAFTHEEGLKRPRRPVE
jgi:hypothetical protein